jgi:hypothetical protein
VSAAAAHHGRYSGAILKIFAIRSLQGTALWS